MTKFFVRLAKDENFPTLLVLYGFWNLGVFYSAITNEEPWWMLLIPAVLTIGPAALAMFLLKNQKIE